MELNEQPNIYGVVTLNVLSPDHVTVFTQSNYNTLTYPGLSIMAQALAYSGVEDIAGTIGIPDPYYMAPIYGAIGAGEAVVPTSGDNSLVDEFARTTAAVAASLPAAGPVNATTVWQFFFGNSAFLSHYNPVTQGIEIVNSIGITEAGMFVQATNSSGTLFNHVAISPTVFVPAGYLLQLQINIAFLP